jgi:hypothetical protein
MSVSKPYRDPSSRKAEPDWLITVKAAAVSQTYRFDTEQEARKFAAAARREASKKPSK